MRARCPDCGFGAFYRLGDGRLRCRSCGRPLGRAHIKGIEGFWSYAKNFLYPYRGARRRLLPLYLAELSFRYNEAGRDLTPGVAELLRRVARGVVG